MYVCTLQKFSRSYADGEFAAEIAARKLPAFRCHVHVHLEGAVLFDKQLRAIRKLTSCFVKGNGSMGSLPPASRKI